jgi:hypothetical protein
MLGPYDPVRCRLLMRKNVTKCSSDFVALLNDRRTAYGTTS